MRYNINIIFKRRARNRISIMGCIESRDAGLVAFSLRLRPPCRRAAVPPTLCFERSGAKRRKGVAWRRRRHCGNRFSFLFPLSLHLVQAVAFRLMDGICSLFFSVCPRLGMRVKRYRHHVHIPDMCPSSWSIYVFPSLVCTAEGRRVFSLDATRRDCPLRFFSVPLVVSRASTARSRRLDVV